MRREGCEVILGPPAEQLDGEDWDVRDSQLRERPMAIPAVPTVC